jgi:hypothetical protein
MKTITILVAQILVLNTKLEEVVLQVVIGGVPIFHNGIEPSVLAQMLQFITPIMVPLGAILLALKPLALVPAEYG